MSLPCGKDFRPSWPLTSGHLQTMLSSSGVRRLLLPRAARMVQEGAEPVMVDGGGGVRLTGAFTAQKTRPQPRGLPINRIGLRPTNRLGQGAQRTLITLQAPRRDQRRVQPFPTQQRALTSLVQAVVLAQDPRLVRRGICPRLRPAGHLRIRCLITRTHGGWNS